MQVTLDDKQTAEIKTLVFSIVKDGIQQVTNTRPYLNRKDIQNFLGVAESPMGFGAKLGMPVAIMGGGKP